MKTRLLPIYFKEANERERGELRRQLEKLRELYGAEAEFLPAAPLDSGSWEGADALLFPQMIGAIFAYKEILKKVSLPVIVLTSEFGTVEMWDWEIVAWLREEVGIPVFTPYNTELAKVILRSISSKKEMETGTKKFLMMQDSPGEGMQAYIFKRFYWWERECVDQIERAFGIKIIFRSWREVNRRAESISDGEAAALWRERAPRTEGVPEKNIWKAVKLYMAIKDLIDEIGGVAGVGSNCLNESFHSGTTPCLAWDWLFEYDGVLWACEGDLVTLISKFILYSALRRPIMMTNIYPFLVGMAALKHEKIETFPDIEDPDNHALGVHCGYFGFAPESFCAHWTMRPKVLEIVNEDAIVIDCISAAFPQGGTGWSWRRIRSIINS